MSRSTFFLALELRIPEPWIDGDQPPPPRVIRAGRKMRVGVPPWDHQDMTRAKWIKHVCEEIKRDLEATGFESMVATIIDKNRAEDDKARKD
jgi:hypothetical protein